MPPETTRSPTGRAPRPREVREVDTPERLAAAVRELGAEPVACLVCEAPAPRRIFQDRGKWHWECRACRLVFVHDIYPEFVDGIDGGAMCAVLHSERPSRTQRKLYARALADLAPHRQLGSLLDVGCGPGNFLLEARAAGWQVTGVELVPESADFARTERGLDVRCCELSAADLPDGAFDAVHLSEVIEHVVDPLALMLEIKRVLRPGGLAYLRTGCAESWSARLRGGAWPYYEFCALGHIRFYGPSSARALARAAGFRSVSTSTHGFAFREGGELAGRWYRPLVRWAQAPISPLAGLLGRGHRLTMRFVK